MSRALSTRHGASIFTYVVSLILAKTAGGHNSIILVTTHHWNVPRFHQPIGVNEIVVI